MGKRGAAGPPGLGMTGFSYNLPLPGGNGASTKRGLTWRGASQVPIQVREPKQSAHGGTEGRGGILLQNGEIWEIFAAERNGRHGRRAGVYRHRRKNYPITAEIYSSGRTNSKPNRRHSPKNSSRK